MKTRFGFVSNSSSSSFIIKKCDIDLKDLKLFLLDRHNQYSIHDEEDYKDEMDQNNNHYLHNHYHIGTMSGDDEYIRAHLELLDYLDKHNIKEVTGEVGYEGDGRCSKDEEIQMLTMLKNNNGDIEKTTTEFIATLP